MPNEIFVTRPYLPPIDELSMYLEKIWASRVLTNCGPLHSELEVKLVEYLKIKHLSLFANGTIALVTALQALQVKGEIITTPYSFVATAHAILWNGLTPVFVDIEPNGFNIDPDKIEAAITPATSAILAVHCYGYPCQVARIERIATKHNLRVIYDAAHAFGVDCHCGDSVLNYGDLSVLSFHATKVFNTFEGGAIVSRTRADKVKIDHLKNFGFTDEVTVEECGINGKLSELHSAVGLVQLPHMVEVLAARQRVDARYRKALCDFSDIVIPPLPAASEPNFSYFPILFYMDKPGQRERVYQRLREKGIYTRRYFYPLISSFPMYRNLKSASSENLPNAENVADRVLCLPIYPELTQADQDRVIAALHHALAS